MTDEEILKAFGLTKESPISEQIVQTTHHWLSACDKITELEEQNGKLETRCAELFLQNNEFAEQLTKAKYLLLRFIELKNKPCAIGHSVNMLLYENICAEVEQFLNEVEK